MPKKNADRSPSGLTPKQARFVVEYLKDLNGTQAAIRAGYSESTARQQACRLLTNADIAATVAEQQQQQLTHAELTATATLEAIRRQVQGDVRALFDEHGNLRPIKELSAEEASLIAGFEVVIKNAAAGDGHTDTVHKVKLKNQERFVEMAAKHFGLLTEKLEITGGAELIDRLMGARRRAG
jgi:phage terminase small subunit